MRTLATHNLALLTLLALVGCKHHDRASVSAKPAAPPPGQFVSPNDRFSVNYAADWQRRENSENVLTVHAPTGSAELSIAVPNLPPHIPGLIPLGPVQNGYVDDLKKNWKSAVVENSVKTKIAGANARRFTVTARRDKTVHKLAVVAITRGDKLYIMTAEADDADFPEAQKAFDLAAQSWSWK